MLDPLIPLLIALIGYLSGSISFARLVTRWAAPGIDLAQLQIPVDGKEQGVNVGIVGANAASMVLGPRLGLLVAGLDMAKVALPMLLVRYIFPEQPYYLFLSLAGLIGHNWPLYYRFKGGRGFAVILASFLIVDWVGTLVVLFLGLTFGMVVVGNPMIAYISWLWWIIPWMIWRGSDWDLIYVVAVNALFVLAILPDIRTILSMRKSGNLRAYTENLYNSSPRWRGMTKLTKKIWVFQFIVKKNQAEKN